jgi:hypothetical protein
LVTGIMYVGYSCTEGFPDIGSTLPNTLSRGKTLLISLRYMFWCMRLCARSKDLQSCRYQAPGGVGLVTGGPWRSRELLSCRGQVPGGVGLVAGDGCRSTVLLRCRHHRASGR